MLVHKQLHSSSTFFIFRIFYQNALAHKAVLLHETRDIIR